MRTIHRGAAAVVLPLVIGLPPSQGAPVLAQAEQRPSILFSELYSLNADPYRTADPASIAKLEDLPNLEALMRVFRSCATATCREAEDAP